MSPITRRRFIKYFGAGTVTASLAPLFSGMALYTGQPSTQEPPNIVLINVDDLGWTDLSCMGSTYFETPHIDRLASQGIRFTDGYAACAVCSPTRAAIMTGRYPARTGVTDWIRARFQGGEIPEDRQNPTEYVKESDKKFLTPPNALWMELEEITIAEMSEKAGYVSCHIGKWHLGADTWYPTEQGFDYNIGGCDFGQPPSYFDPYCNDYQGCIPTIEPRKEGEYLTDRESDEAVRFITSHQGEPFFLYMAHYAVHTPIQGKEELTQRYQQKPPANQKDPEYAAMVHSVDQSTGRIMQTLDELGLAENTLVIFTSDNGGLVGPTDNAPLRSGKGYPYEGGIRVPVIIRWPDVVPAATVSYEPVISMDYFPTILEAVGVDLPENRNIDGVSLLSHLESGGRTALQRDTLFWHFPHYRQGHQVPPYGIVRNGDWKLIKWYEDPTYELYNLHNDIGEQQNLAMQMPAKVRELNALLSNTQSDTNAKMPRSNPGYDPAAEQRWWQEQAG